MYMKNLAHADLDEAPILARRRLSLLEVVSSLASARRISEHCLCNERSMQVSIANRSLVTYTAFEVG